MTYPICKFEECEKWMLEMLALFNFIDIDSRKSWWKVYYGDKKIRVACMKSYRKKEIDYLLSKGPATSARSARCARAIEMSQEIVSRKLLMKASYERFPLLRPI